MVKQINPCGPCVYNVRTDRCIHGQKRTAKLLHKQTMEEGWNLFYKVKNQYGVFDKDVGGGGDCLFYCFGQIYLDFMKEVKRPTERQTKIYRQVQRNTLYFRKWIAEQFTETLLTNIARSMVVGEASVSKEERRTFLKTFFQEEGFWLKLGFSDEESQQLASRSTSLSSAVKQAKQMKRMSSQWGGEFDIAMFEKLTNIGILVLSPHGKKLFYCTTQSKVHAYQALIRNIDMIHYTVAGVKDQEGHIHTVWRRKTIPEWLTQKLEMDCPKQ